MVIAIIGILSSVVLASLNSARQKSRDARRVSDIKQLQLALELYFDTNGEYPTALASLETGGQIASIPTDPVGGAAYPYFGLNANCTSYHLGATLEQTDHVALNADADAAADGTAAAACLTGAADFDGTVATTYDVKP